MAPTDRRICADVSDSEFESTSVCRLERSASKRALFKLATTALSAEDCSCDALAACSAPAAICSMDCASCFVAAADCASPLASCSVAAPMRSDACSLRTGRCAGDADGGESSARLRTGLLAGSGVTLLRPEAIFDFLTNAM